MATTDPNLDLDTQTKGTTGPIELWEGDLTALVHALGPTRHNGWALADNYPAQRADPRRVDIAERTPETVTR